MIPAIMTGMTDFMMSSGRITPIDEMPTADLAVPYAAPSTKAHPIFNAAPLITHR